MKIVGSLSEEWVTFPQQQRNMDRRKLLRRKAVEDAGVCHTALKGDKHSGLTRHRFGRSDLRNASSAVNNPRSSVEEVHKECVKKVRRRLQ